MRGDLIEQLARDITGRPDAHMASTTTAVQATLDFGTTA